MKNIIIELDNNNDIIIKKMPEDIKLTIFNYDVSASEKCDRCKQYDSYVGICDNCNKVAYKDIYTFSNNKVIKKEKLLKAVKEVKEVKINTNEVYNLKFHSKVGKYLTLDKLESIVGKLDEFCIYEIQLIADEVETNILERFCYSEYFPQEIIENIMDEATINK